MLRHFLALLLLAIATGCASIEPPPQRANVRDVVVDEAMAQLGRSYRYSGSDPTGFDSGGLVYYVFARAGVAVPRTAEEQHGSGHRVSYSGIQRGDLLFYTLEGKEREELHVGICIDAGRMVHIAKDSRVEIEIIDNPYWQKRYLDSVSLLP